MIITTRVTIRTTAAITLKIIIDGSNDYITVGFEHYNGAGVLTMYCIMTLINYAVWHKSRCPHEVYIEETYLKIK